MEKLDLSKFKLEHTECDFKREVEHKKTKNWLKSVSAFANGIGGALIFGIDDENRQYCPIADLQGEIEFITECIKDRISPIPHFVLKPETVDGNTVLVLKVSGGMYDGIPVQDQELDNVISTRRNPVIADLLTRMDIMERRGSGFRKILDAIKFAPNYTDENLPVFISNPYSFSVTFKNMNYGVEPISEESSQNTEETIAETAQKSDLKTIKWPEKWPEKCQQILEAINDDSNVTIAKLVSILDIGHTTIKKMLAEMQNEGFIRRVGADKGGHWEIDMNELEVNGAKINIKKIEGVK